MSPIERMMLVELQRRSAADIAERGSQLANDAERDRDTLLAEGFDPDIDFLSFSAWIAIQECPIAPYRVDFAFFGMGGRVCVECDGHDYHERTPGQAMHDRRRDRFFQKNGWHVMRFTGTEIVRDAAACADELFELLGILDDRFIRTWQRERDLSTGRVV